MSDQTVAPVTTNEAKEPKAKTVYVVLAQATGDESKPDSLGYMKLTEVEAVSSNAAIRSLKKEGTFVAVPARSFVPVTVKTETKTVLKLS